MKTSVKIGIIIFIFSAVVYIYLAQRIGGNRERYFYNRFDKAVINGRIEYVKMGYHGSVFKIIGDKNKYVFYPYTNNLNDNKIFYNLATRGDLISKPMHADTLKLQKDNVIYLYTFQKFE